MVCWPSQGRVKTVCGGQAEVSVNRVLNWAASQALVKDTDSKLRPAKRKLQIRSQYASASPQLCSLIALGAQEVLKHPILTHFKQGKEEGFGGWGGGGVHVTCYKECVALFFIFTSYSSMKGSFVVCWLIDFNKNHSIVAKVGFYKLNCVPPTCFHVWVGGRGRGFPRPGCRLWKVGGGVPDTLDGPDAHEKARPSHPHIFARGALIPYPPHSKKPYLLQGEFRKCDYGGGGGKTIFRRGRGGMRGRDKGFLF